MRYVEAFLNDALNFADADFEAKEASDDDESTIAKAEKKQKNVDEEVSALQKECDLELDDILDSLPADYFENRDRMLEPTSDVRCRHFHSLIKECRVES